MLICSRSTWAERRDITLKVYCLNSSRGTGLKCWPICVPGYSPWPCRWPCLASFGTLGTGMKKPWSLAISLSLCQDGGCCNATRSLIHNFLSHRPKEDARCTTWLQYARAAVHVVYHIDRFKASDEQQLVITVLWGKIMCWVKLNIPYAKAKAQELP